MKDLRKIEAANKHIFETYIADESPMQVNLDPQLQMALEHDYRSPAKRRTKVLFLAAKRELLRHLEFEFTRFREHENFYDLEASQRAGKAHFSSHRHFSCQYCLTEKQKNLKLKW